VCLLHWENFTHENPHYRHYSHRRKKSRHEEQHDFYPRRDWRRWQYVSDGPNGQVTNWTSSHCAQSQKSLSQFVDGEYGQHVSRNAESHVHRLYIKYIHSHSLLLFILFISVIDQFNSH